MAAQNPGLAEYFLCNLLTKTYFKTKGPSRLAQSQKATQNCTEDGTSYTSGVSIGVWGGDGSKLMTHRETG
jgi:hypothetical protein